MKAQEPDVQKLESSIVSAKLESAQNCTQEIRGTGSTPEQYVVVHLVVQEACKPLVLSQVIDHMEWQAAAGGSHAPSAVMVVFLEPARVALSNRLREYVRQCRARAPHITVEVLPYVSRFSPRFSSRWLSTRIRRWGGTRRIVFHCRGERAVEWGAELARRLGGAGILADIRGPWGDELLYARGFDGPEQADDDVAGAYHRAMSNLRAALGLAGAVSTVSPGMRNWLVELGVGPKKVAYVPCCVSRVTYSEPARTRMRKRLGLDGSLVLAYAGSASPYQYLLGALVPFVSATLRCAPDVTFLGLTPDEARLTAMLHDGGVDRNRIRIICVPQEEVAGYLAAADGGLILPHLVRLRNVVQPVKLAEYAAAGLPIVVSRGTGSIDALIDRFGAGVLVDIGFGDRIDEEAARAVAALKANGEQMRQGAIRMCQEEFLWSRYTATVRQSYRLANEARIETSVKQTLG